MEAHVGVVVGVGWQPTIAVGQAKEAGAQAGKGRAQAEEGRARQVMSWYVGIDTAGVGVAWLGTLGLSRITLLGSLLCGPPTLAAGIKLRSGVHLLLPG